LKPGGFSDIISTLSINPAEQHTFPDPLGIKKQKTTSADVVFSIVGDFAHP
jgi:hypothetical protein